MKNNKLVWIGVGVLLAWFVLPMVMGALGGRKNSA